MMLVTCPKCHSLFQAPETLANQRVKCPKCQAQFTVPNPAGASIPASTTPQLEPLAHALAPSDLSLASPASSFTDLSYREEESQRERQRYFSRSERDGADAPGVISLIFGCLAVLCALFGCLTFGVAAYAALPFALIGGLVGFYGRGNMRVAGLLLNFLALIPAVVVTFIIIGSMFALKEAEARLQEEQRQREVELLAETRRRQAETRARQAEAERLRQQAALKEKEARLQELRRQQEREEAQQRAEKKHEEDERRVVLERQRQEEAARKKAELEAKEEANRRADLEKRGLPYYPPPRTLNNGHNAEEWYQLLRDKPQDARIYAEATAALTELKAEGVPFLLDYLSHQGTPKNRNAILRLIKIEFVHRNDLHKLLPCLSESKNYPSARLLVLQWLETRAKELRKELVAEIERLIDDMLDNPRVREEVKQEIRNRIVTIRREAKLK